jgi:hypothetical protein
MSVTLTRQDLYDRVWAEPVDTLAKEYGLSNVGLGQGLPPPRYPGSAARLLGAQGCGSDPAWFEA